MRRGRPGGHAAASLMRLAWRAGGRGAWRFAVERAPEPIGRRLRRLRVAAAVAAGERAVPVEQLEDVFRSALTLLLERRPPHELGDYLEFGVYVGDSLAAMHRVSAELGLGGLRLFGFDSFAGLPAAAAEDDEGPWAPGSFASDEEFTRRNLSRLGVDWQRTTLVPGWYEETLTPETRAQHDIHRASVVMVDCDLYSSTVPVLRFCEPLIDSGTVFVFDDWDSAGLGDRGLGEGRAFAEFLAAHDDLTAQELSAYFPARAFLVSRSR